MSGILIPKRKDGVPPMTERQKKFAEYYAQCGNAAQSAIQAGYSKKYANTNASKLLQNTTITEYIKQLTEDAQTARITMTRTHTCGEELSCHTKYSRKKMEHLG